VVWRILRAALRPDVPFAQPANVIGGHVICALIGLITVHAFGAHAWSLGLAVGASIAAMMATRTVHPPAGFNPVIAFLGQPGWSFMLFPVLRKITYPQYW
jgi:CBS-domain-containing membrane protein